MSNLERDGDQVRKTENETCLPVEVTKTENVRLAKVRVRQTKTDDFEKLGVRKTNLGLTLALALPLANALSLVCLLDLLYGSSHFHYIF